MIWNKYSLNIKRILEKSVKESEKVLLFFNDLDKTNLKVLIKDIKPSLLWI